MFAFLLALDLNPVEWEDARQATGKASPYTGEIVEALFNTTQAAVVLFTGDEDVSLRESLRSEPAADERGVQSRPNVLFEAGLAFGKYPERTILVQIGPHRHVSDLLGRHMVHFDGSPEKRDPLRTRLRAAGCTVKEAGTRWVDAGQKDLEAALKLAEAPIRPPPLPVDPLAPKVWIESYGILWGMDYAPARPFCVGCYTASKMWVPLHSEDQVSPGLERVRVYGCPHLHPSITLGSRQPEPSTPLQDSFRSPR
jgi:hypothetical protein